MFQHHGILMTFPIEIGGNTIFVEVEVVDSPLDYNLLLGHSWFYETTTIVLSIIQVLHFSHQGKIMTIDQLAYYKTKIRTNAGYNVPFVGDSKSAYKSLGARMFKKSSLMGTFTLPPPPFSTNVAPINIIYFNTSGSCGYFDPWVVPHPQKLESYGAHMPLRVIDISYEMI